MPISFDKVENTTFVYITVIRVCIKHFKYNLWNHAYIRMLSTTYPTRSQHPDNVWSNTTAIYEWNILSQWHKS